MNTLGSLTRAVAALFCAVPLGLQAQLYWDTNGAAAGAGTIANGTWGGDAFWNTNAAGTGSPGAWVVNGQAFFSAGTDVSSATITVDGNQSVQAVGASVQANALWIEEGSYIFNGVNNGRLIFGSQDGLTVNSGASATFGSTLGISMTSNVPWDVFGSVILDSVVNGTGQFRKNGTGTLTVNTAFTNFTQFQLNAGTLVLGNDHVLGAPTTPVILGNNTTVQTVNSTARTQGNSVQVNRLSNDTLKFSGPGNITFGGAVTTTGALPDARTYTFEVDGIAVTFGGGLNIVDSDATPNAASIIKTGSGTLILGGSNNNYTGGTTINSGTILANNTSGSGLGTGAVIVNAGATLGGTGSIALSGGNSISIATDARLMGGDGSSATGALTINNDLSLADDSVIVLTLGNAGAHSSIARAGGIWTFDSNQAFLFVDAGMSAGIYTNLLTGLSIDPGVANWTVLNPGWEGSSFTYAGGNVSLNLVPEPSATVLLFVGALAATAVRRKRA